eukprot:8699589-Pyramimonas_sp.AAC.1
MEASACKTLCPFLRPLAPLLPNNPNRAPEYDTRGVSAQPGNQIVMGSTGSFLSGVGVVGWP